METILIAGGSGLIGKELTELWTQLGFTVRILTRGQSNPAKHQFNWDVEKGVVDQAALVGVTTLVNLSGAGIADKRWTAKRKLELMDSRIQTTKVLHAHFKASTTLKHYISASGIVCYGFDEPEKLHPESDPFGPDYLSVITKDWEAAADAFSSQCVVTKLRISVVLSGKGGALKTIAAPIKYGFGTVLGSGNQGVPWVYLPDLALQFEHVRKNRLAGAFNTNTGNTTNAVLTKTIAKTLKKPLWLPKAPAWALKLVLGEMATVVLDGLQADNSKLLASGYSFQYPDLEETLKEIYIR